MRRLVVVGGGITGLAAAWTARRLAAQIPDGLDIVVLEKARRVGGKARSPMDRGWLVESGPGGFLSGRPELTQLIEDAGLAPQATPANAAAARRFIYRAGALREIVPNPVGFARSGILSPAGLLRFLGEPFLPRRVDGVEETVWAFAARRLGAEVADRLIMPMTLGIFAGDAKRLSLPAAFPKMHTLEREHGSLIRGLIAKRGKTAAGTLTSFPEGIETLPRTLAERGGFAVRCDAEVTTMIRDGTQWQVRLAGDATPLVADVVVLAGEPWAMAPLLRPLSAAAADDLDGIYCPPVTVVGLGYADADCPAVPRGFGVLITRGEGFRMLGNLWDSYIFPHRSPDGHVLIRLMLGGAVDPDAGQLSEDDAIALARSEVARMYGITATPRFECAVRWPRAIAQYELGHLARVSRIDAATRALGGVVIGGSGLNGVSFADAAVSGVRCGEEAVERLRSRIAPA
jgi:oxygen-dependent protoporphyrinogen oxidase